MPPQTAETAGPDSSAAAQTAEPNGLKRRYRAESLIKNHVMAAGAFSVVPLWVIDIRAIIIVQLRMIQKLAAMYGKAFSESPVRNTISGLAGGVVGHSAGVFTALSVAKVASGLGSLFGIVSLPVAVGASTFAIGRVYLRHFLSKGGQVAEAAKRGMRKRSDRGAQNGVDAPWWLGTRPGRSGWPLDRTVVRKRSSRYSNADLALPLTAF